jgi:formamidopyrimidine-DNA glycosylase
MPELPEVESLRRSLLPHVIDQEIVQVEVKLSKLVSGRGTKRHVDESKPVEFMQNLVGKKIATITRRAKNLIIELEDDSAILVHLKMTGQLVFKPKLDSKQTKSHLIFGGHPIQETELHLPHKHTYVIFELTNGTLFYNDVRQFGYLLYFANKNEIVDSGHFDDLGFEPFAEDFTFQAFNEKLVKKTGNLKKVFLDQTVVVGLGNIYADEVCFRAGVKPTRTVKSLKPEEIKKLYEAIKHIIPLAVDLGGSSVANYLLADGSRGNYAREHKVYNRGGKECYTCGSILEKVQQAGRTTVFCAHCQK